MTLDKTIERAERLMPDLRTEIIPDVGHAIPIEQPDLFNDRVLDFITEIDDRLGEASHTEPHDATLET